MIVASIFLSSGLLMFLKKDPTEKIRRQCKASQKLFSVVAGVKVFAALGVLTASFFAGATDWVGFFGAVILIYFTLTMFYYEIQTENDKKKLLLLLTIVALCIVFLVSVAMR